MAYNFPITHIVAPLNFSQSGPAAAPRVGAMTLCEAIIVAKHTKDLLVWELQSDRTVPVGFGLNTETISLSRWYFEQQAPPQPEKLRDRINRRLVGAEVMVTYQKQNCLAKITSYSPGRIWITCPELGGDFPISLKTAEVITANGKVKLTSIDLANIFRVENEELLKELDQL